MAFLRFWNKSSNAAPQKLTAELPKKLGDDVDEPTPPNDPISEPVTLSTSAEAIAEYQKHLRTTAEKYRLKLSEWEQIAVDLGYDPHDLKNAHEKHNFLSLVKHSMTTLGDSLKSLHHSFEPVSVHFVHLVSNVHKEIHQTHLTFSTKINELKQANNPEDQKRLKFEIACLGILIWNNLTELEVDVGGLIESCLSFQRNSEKALNVAINLTENLIIALLIYYAGDYENLFKLKIDHVSFKDVYDNYLYNHMQAGKNLTDLQEAKLGSLLAEGEDLIKPQKVEQVARCTP